ncbi:Flotillin-like protein 4 [Ranunculus cassubicifolius]
MKYKIARASEYLVITGVGIKDLKIVKKGWVFPGQSCIVMDISPVNYTVTVEAMTREKRQFGVPAVFTIGPRWEDMDSLRVYAKVVAGNDEGGNHVKDLVLGVVEGETRAVAASLSTNELFKGTQEFKQAVYEKVQVELNKFGLLIYNANVKQLVGKHGRMYSFVKGIRMQSETANQAKIDVAEANMKGEIGVKEREGKLLQCAAKVDAETKMVTMQRQGEGKKKEIRVNTDVQIFQSQRDAEIAEANSELAMKKARWTQQAQMANVEAAKAVALRESELQREVEKTNAMTQTEKLKAEFLSKASVEYDTKAQEANWRLYKKQKEAEAELYETEKEGAAKRALASAELYAREQSADGELYAKQKEAEGMPAIAQAQDVYMQKLLEALGGNYDIVRDYLMIHGGMYQELARLNVEAIQGLQPEFSIWSNGNSGRNMVRQQ